MNSNSNINNLPFKFNNNIIVLKKNGEENKIEAKT